MYVNWGVKHSTSDLDNKAALKTESSVSVPSDSSYNMMTKPSPKFQQWATPERFTLFTQPATAQNCHSAPSYYQNPVQTNFSPETQFANNINHGFSQSQHSNQIIWDQGQYNQDYHKSCRFHPYNIRAQERITQVTSSSPMCEQTLNLPTPSPSPNQCNKCGFVSDSAVQLYEHCNAAHADAGPAPLSTSVPILQFSGKQYSDTDYQNENLKLISDILDLDSQILYQGAENEQAATAFVETPPQTQEVNTRTVPMMPWPAYKIYSNLQSNGDVSLYKEPEIDQQPYSSNGNVFYPEQNFEDTLDKYFSEHHDQNPFMHVKQKMYTGVPPLADNSAPTTASNADMIPQYRPYDASAASQMTGTQPLNPISSTLPSIGDNGANQLKSNEVKHPQSYHCTVCNKWFTSSGHLKRHYSTTIHKNAVRSSGQPNPATLPISNHHHPSRDIHNRTQQHSMDSKTQISVPSEDIPSVVDTVLKSPNARRVATMQSKSPYTHLQQGNLDNNFTNNFLANHPLQHQVGSHPLNINSHPPGLGNPNVSKCQSSKALANSGSPSNGEADPSASRNHHMSGLLSITDNLTPALTQSILPPLKTHTLPPFSHLRSTEPLGPTIPGHTNTPLSLGQNFEPSLTTNNLNGISLHVMDMAINNLPVANPATFSKSPEVVKVIGQETVSEPVVGALPSFAQLQSRLNVNKYIVQPNVEGQVLNNKSSGSNVIVHSVKPTLHLDKADKSTQNLEYHFNLTDRKMTKDNISSYNQDIVKNYHYGITIQGETIKRGNVISEAQAGMVQLMQTANKQTRIKDNANKENYKPRMKSPAILEYAKVVIGSSGSVVPSTNVSSTPLAEQNQMKEAASTTVHKCFLCNKLFNKGCYLKQHNKTFHSGDKPYKCTICGKRFSDDYSFELHIHRHSNNKPFKCEQCPKSFNHKSDLRRHMCLHSNNMPFSCAHCGKGFIRKDHMIKHVETHKRKLQASVSPSSITPGSSTSSTSSSQGFNITH